jgi:hypothetical protein
MTFLKLVFGYACARYLVYLVYLNFAIKLNKLIA